MLSFLERSNILDRAVLNTLHWANALLLVFFRAQAWTAAGSGGWLLIQRDFKFAKLFVTYRVLNSGCQFLERGQVSSGLDGQI